MKIILAIVTVATLLVFTLNMAHGSETHNGSVTNNYYSSDGSVYGVASAIAAANCHFDGGLFDLQVCGAAGYANSRKH